MRAGGSSTTVAVRGMALVVVLVVGGVFGVWRATADAGAGPATLVVGGAAYTVTHAEEQQGLTDADLSGMSHGIQGLVTDESALVTVTLVVSAGSTARSYDASVLKAYPVGSSQGYAPVGGTLSPGRLRAHAHIEGSISYVVPRDGAQLVLRAPGRTRELPLLTVDVAPAGAGAHQHPTPASTPAPK